MSAVSTLVPTASWILYGLIVGTLLAAVAALGESVLRAAGRSARWLWAGALGLTVMLVVIAPGRGPAASTPAIDGAATTASATAIASADPSWSARATAAAAALVERIAEPARWLLGAAERAVPGYFDRWLGIAWLALSLTVLALFVIVYVRFASARTRWPLARIHDTSVRVAPDAGPAVVGLSHPEIVIPQWLFDRTSDEQRLVLAHESEHLSARDPLLLAAACVAAAMIPWNPAAWWMLSRLRLAVELDCDARVLRRGVAARFYGSLLIDLAGRCSGLRIGAPALADESSHLQQRLIAMTKRTSRISVTRTVAACALAGVATLAACEAKLPTQNEVDNMTAASAASAAQKALFVAKDSADRFDMAGAQYIVDGASVSAADANAIPAERIASIDITKGSSAPNGVGQITITTRQPGDTSRAHMLTKRIAVGDGGTLAPPLTAPPADHLEKFSGIILVDGVRVTPAAMQALSPADIVSIQVIKGPTATTLSDAPEAANGIIRITTKKGAAKK